MVQFLEDEGNRILDTPVLQQKAYNKEWFHYSQLSDLFAHAILEKAERTVHYSMQGYF